MYIHDRKGGETQMTDMLSKAGRITQQVALQLCDVPLDEKIPTVSELVERCGASRGNVQKALSNLKDGGAVELEAHGQSGTLLTSIDYIALAKICGREHLVGTMPLPYTLRYEGLATALHTLLNVDGMRSFITFLRGSEARVQMLLDGSADYSLMSKMAFDSYVSRGYPLSAALVCSPLSYVGRHVLLSLDPNRADWSSARVGIDESSVDQGSLTQRYFEGVDVEYVPVQYTHIVDMILAGELDAGIWNEDDVHVKAANLSARPVENLGMSDSNTRAVVVVRNDDTFSRQLIKELVTAALVDKIQHKVMEGKLAVCY